MTQATGETGMNERTIISVRNLVKYFPIEAGFLRRQVGVVKAVDDVNFDLNEGETLALVGESGCGKTTTSHCIIQDRSSRLRVRSCSVSEMLSRWISPNMEKGELKEARRNIRMIYQDPYSSLNPRMTLLQIIGEPLVIHRMVQSQDALQERVAELLRLVRLDHLNDEQVSARIQRRAAAAHRDCPRTLAFAEGGDRG